VTVTTVPFGIVRWAHVPSGAWNHVAGPRSAGVTAPVDAGRRGVSAAGSVTSTGTVVVVVGVVVVDAPLAVPVGPEVAVTVVVVPPAAIAGASAERGRAGAGAATATALGSVVTGAAGS
jgi:hypothetical protein